MANFSERVRRPAMSPPPGHLPTARRATTPDPAGASAHHALWWVVCYEGARDYAQAVHDGPDGAGHDAGSVVRLVDAVHARTPA